MKYRRLQYYCPSYILYSAKSCGSSGFKFLSREDLPLLQIASVETESVVEVLSNPVHDNLSVMVSGSSGEGWRLDLYDISGRCVVSESGVMESTGFVEELDVQRLPSGVYVLRGSIGGVKNVRSVNILR